MTICCKSKCSLEPDVAVLTDANANRPRHYDYYSNKEKQLVREQIEK
jgi:hypothetical protein